MNDRSRPKAAPESVADDYSVTRGQDSAAFRADATWTKLAQCPPSSVQWAALGYAAACADADLDRARQLGVDGFAAARLARPFLAMPRHDELAGLRSRPSTAACTAKCGRCSCCVRALVVASNMRRFGSPDWPGRKAVAA
jgi:hypothetical protein